MNSDRRHGGLPLLRRALNYYAKASSLIVRCAYLRDEDGAKNLDKGQDK